MTSQNVSQSNSKTNSKQSKQHKKQTNVRSLLNDICEVAGQITKTLEKSTSQGKLLNPQELKNLQVASDILRSTRESQLKAKLLKSHQKEQEQLNQPQPIQLDSASILEFLKQANKAKSKEEAIDVNPA